MRHILFIINGLGMGNSTRCHAIIQELQNMGAKITIISSGNGAAYFKSVGGVGAVHEVTQMHYASQGDSISILKTLALLPEYRRTLQKNANLIEDVISKTCPDIVVTDSTYVTKPMRRRKIPIIAINNADYVIRNYFKMGKFPPLSTLAQFVCVELMDYLFHRLAVDIVLSPSLVPMKLKALGKFRAIGPLVRQGYDPYRSDDKSNRCVIMLSGSAFGSQIHAGFDTQGFHVDVIGRNTPEDWDGTFEDIVFHGKVFNNINIVRKADLAVVNCGYSAVCESINMHNPLVVVPVPNHAEQWVNAKMVEKWELGIIASENCIDEGISKVKQNLKCYTQAFKRLSLEKESVIGRKQAADIIFKFPSDPL